MAKEISVAIFGASGYSGEELIKLLLRHPNVKIQAITSRQHAGKTIDTVFPRFLGSRLSFVEPDVSKIAPNVDVAFLALPHGLAAEYAEPLLSFGVRVIDISADFRLRSLSKYAKYYGQEHPAPSILSEAIYGLPERYRGDIKGANLIACPGCYPTSIILPATAILTAGLAKTSGIIASSMSGVSGAGRKESIPLLFAECNESVRPYSVTGHRHIPEIEQELAVAAGVDELRINFVPHLIPVTRGIHSTIFMEPARDDITVEDLYEAFQAAYSDESFVRILPLGAAADTKHVTQTNVCEIACFYDQHTNKIILSSAEDNLTKGASGQAIQCLNIIFDLDETTGLL
ncbi:MAG: N-acetyl-gamma-glutamyl-phosphate reductase [Lentisphaeria bacterium]|nr:N-acetyl-gamma-glutamyl-phosphate reductase [Lentisphaeria bacterium]